MIEYVIETKWKDGGRVYKIDYIVKYAGQQNEKTFYAVPGKPNFDTVPKTVIRFIKTAQEKIAFVPEKPYLESFQYFKNPIE